MIPSKPKYEPCPERLFGLDHKWEPRYWDKFGMGVRNVFWGWLCKRCGKAQATK